MATKDQIIDEIARLAAGFPNQAITESSYITYAATLQNFDLKAIELAVDLLLTSAQFFPTTSEVFRQCEKAEITLKAIKDAQDPKPFEWNHDYYQEMRSQYAEAGIIMPDLSPDQIEARGEAMSAAWREQGRRPLSQLVAEQLQKASSDAIQSEAGKV